jgi:hypothetical protein
MPSSHLVAYAEGVERTEGVGPRKEGEPGRPAHRRRLQNHAPNALPLEPQGDGEAGQSGAGNHDLTGGVLLLDFRRHCFRTMVSALDRKV